MNSPLWWGTYPPLGLGTPVGCGEGLYLQRGPDAVLAVQLDAPSFVVAHPSAPLLYAVSESPASQLHVVDVAGEPQVLASAPTGGQEACHVLLSPDGTVAYVSHFGSGDVAVFRLGEDGVPVEPGPQQLLSHSGSGPRPDRQERSHAHFSGFAPGQRHLLVADLGTDELRRYRLRDDGLLDEDGIAAVLPPGSGPRHFAVRGQLIYVVCELDHRLRTLRWEGDEAVLVAEVPTTLAPRRTGDDVYDAHVAVVDGVERDVLLVSVRGADVIALFDLSPEGEARYRTSLDAGHWPRHFARVGDRLHVACERGHEARSYELARVLALPPDSAVGAIAALPYESAAVTSPACVATTA